MKKTISFVCFILLAGSTFSQTKTASKLGTSSKLSHNDSVMCSTTWKVTSVEEWAVVSKPPGEKNQDDMLQMTLDGNYHLIIAGAKKAGKWSRSGQSIYFTDEASGQKFSYKVVSVDPTKIKVDHYSDEDGHSLFEMEPK
jgi:hypothetical protein